MKKSMMFAAVGTAAMLQVCSAGAVDLEAVESNGLKVNYGFDVDIPGSGLTADYCMEVSPDKVEKMSVTASIKDGEDVMDFSLNDIFIVDKDNIYINLKEGTSAVEGIAGDVSSMLAQFGIEGDWISFPLPAFDKLGINFESVKAGQAPEISEEMLNDLMAMVVPFAPTENDGVTTYKIDNEAIIAAAEQADAFFEAHREEVLKMGTPSGNAADAFKDLNLVAPFEKYIGAVAAGMAEGTGAPEEECVSQINQMIEMITAQIVDSISVNYSVNGAELTPEMFDELAIAEGVKEALEGQDILIQLSYDENSAEFVYRVNPAETLIVDAAVQEDGTIGIELKANEETIATGVATVTENGVKAVLDNGSGEELTAEIQMLESGLAAILTTPDGQSMSVSVELKDGLVASVSVPGTALTFSATGKATENGGEGELKLNLDSNGETGVIKGYITYEVPSSPLTIEIPVATDGLEVIKNIASMIFASMVAE